MCGGVQSDVTSLTVVLCSVHLSVDSKGSGSGTGTEIFCMSRVLDHIWMGKVNYSVGHIVFPIHPSLSRVALALSCVFYVPWPAALPLAPVVCFPAVGSLLEQLFYRP